MVTILGWLRAEADRASCSKRSSRSLSSENIAGRILIATERSRRVSRARYTSPIPPAPRGDSISYGPSLVPGARGMVARDYRMEYGQETGHLYRTAELSDLITIEVPMYITNRLGNAVANESRIRVVVGG